MLLQKLRTYIPTYVLGAFSEDDDLYIRLSRANIIF